MAGKPTYEELEQKVLQLEQVEVDRKRAEEALRESEERYRLHFENVLDVIYTVDPEFKVLDISPSVEKLLGYKPKELIGRPFQDLNLLAPESLEQAFSESIRIFKGEQITSTVYQFIARDGTKKWGEISGAPVIRDNQVVAITSVARDITKRKLAEEALRETEEKFRNIAENSLVGVYIIQDGIFIYVNTKFADIFGYSVEECLNNMHFRQTVHPEDLDFVREQISKRVSWEVKSANYAFRGIKKDGTTIHVEIFGSSILLNKKTSITGSILDISERKRLEKDRDKLIADLHKSLSEVKTLRGFLPICSHCKKIRDDKGYWSKIESYIHEHSDAEFSHGICPECAEKYYPEMDLYGKNET